jgi:hypothetical protein
MKHPGKASKNVRRDPISQVVSKPQSASVDPRSAAGNMAMQSLAMSEGVCYARFRSACPDSLPPVSAISTQTSSTSPPAWKTSRIAASFAPDIRLSAWFST